MTGVPSTAGSAAGGGWPPTSHSACSTRPEGIVIPLHRHQLVRLTDDGWRAVCERPWDADARACLAHWAARRLPLVVTRQAPSSEQPDDVSVGLAAPTCWQRRRMALSVERKHVAWFDEFPRADELAPSLPMRRRADWRRLCFSLSELGARTRVYGSHGWQLVSDLSYVHPRSDVDLWVAVADAAHADAVAAVLGAFDAVQGPRLDGELLFPDGRAFAWREWQAWRAGRCSSILTKTLTGATLVRARATGTADADAKAAPS
jgi:phosphoribosyl-dephospho-CoA transferase